MRILGVLVLIFSATGLFAQLQAALNKAWGVEPDPDQGGLKNFLMKRFLSLGMLVVLGFLLLVSTVLTTLIDELSALLQGSSPGAVLQTVMMGVNFLLAWLLASLLFGAAFKILPDANISWSDVRVGAIATGLLFVIGKSLIAWYLQFSEAGSSWGSSAASMVGILVWVYYSSLLMLLGAEFTQVWAEQRGSGIEPSAGAVRVEQQPRRVQTGTADSAGGAG